MSKRFYVYILASQRNGTLYIGVTSDLVKRTWEHKQDLVDGFTRKYGVKVLVYYEVHESPQAAITREKQIKKWERAWKIRLIEKDNPNWTTFTQKSWLSPGVAEELCSYAVIPACFWRESILSGSAFWIPAKGTRE